MHIRPCWLRPFGYRFLLSPFPWSYVPKSGTFRGSWQFRSKETRAHRRVGLSEGLRVVFSGRHPNPSLRRVRGQDASEALWHKCCPAGSSEPVSYASVPVSLSPSLPKYAGAPVPVPRSPYSPSAALQSSADTNCPVSACQLPSSMIPKILLLIKQIRPRTAQINNLRTSIPILLQSRTLETIKRIRDTLASAHNAFVLVVAEGAFVANSDEGSGTDVGVADGTFAVAFVAEPADGDAGGFAAHY